MEKNKKLIVLGEAPVWKALLKLGIPTMVGLMVSALYNLVDAYFVGKLGTSQQAAVSAVFPLGLLMIGVGLLFGCGAGSYLSRLLGKGEHRKANECASTALALSVGTGIVLVIIMLIAINPILRLLGCTDTMMPYARKYAIPFIIGLVINVFNSTMSNIATAEGASIYSMRSMLMGGIANMILDPLLISFFGMGVMGAAVATLIARLISFATYIAFLLQKKSCLHFSIKNIRMEGKLFAEISKIGIPTMMYQLLCSVALGIMDNLASKYGDSAVAACGIVSRVETLGIMMIMGFLKGYQAFVGFNYGAKKYERVKKSTELAVLWTSIFSICGGVLMIILRTQIIHAFNKNDADVFAIGIKALIFNSITFMSVGFQVTYSTKFMGLGKGLAGGLVSLGRQGFFFIPAIYIMTSVWGINGLILSQPIADVLSMILVCILSIKNVKEEKKLIIGV